MRFNKNESAEKGDADVTEKSNVDVIVKSTNSGTVPTKLVLRALGVDPQVDKYCLSVADGVKLSACDNNNPTQQFIFDQSRIKLANYNNICLKSGRAGANGTILVAECDDSESQKWEKVPIDGNYFGIKQQACIRGAHNVGYGVSRTGYDAVYNDCDFANWNSNWSQK